MSKWFARFPSTVSEATCVKLELDGLFFEDALLEQHE